MERNAEDEVLLRSFLLGQLSESKRSDMEAAFLEDGQLFEQLNAAETDLIDDYVRGALPRSEKEQFERHCLSSERIRERVQFAGALKRLPHPQRSRPWLDWLWTWSMPAQALVSTAALVAIIAGVIFWRGPGNPSGPTPVPVVFTFMLAGGSTRAAGGIERRAVPTGTTQIALQLNIEGAAAFSRYQVRLTTPEGRAVWSADGLAEERIASGRAVIARVPAPLLVPGDYLATVAGVSPTGAAEEIKDYSFGISPAK